MSEEKVEVEAEAKENVAEELTEWSEIDTSPTVEKEKVEFEVEGEGEDKAEVEATSSQEKTEIPELDGIETKGAEKRIRQLVQQKKERDAALAQSEAEKQELIRQLNARDHYTVEASKTSNTTSERLLQQQIELAKKSYLDAYDLGEKEKMLEAQEIINKGQVDLSTLSQQRQAIEQYEAQLAQRAEQTATAQQQQQAQPQAQAQAQYDPLAVEWSQKPENSWFNKDQIMTVAALTIDATLKQEGYDSSSPEFYQEVDRRMKTEFPHKFSGEASAGVGSQPTQQVVAGQSRSSTTSAKGKKVKLTQEDVRLAQKWNIPLEKYAAEKARADRAAGEYVPIG